MAKKNDRIKRMKERPYYAVLHAINFLKGRLPEEVEDCLGSDPEACLLYAKEVIKGRLPDSVHNKLIMGSWEGDDANCVKLYLLYLKPKKSASRCI